MGWGCETESKYGHAVFLCYDADVMGRSDGTGDRSLLLVIWEALSGVEGSAALRDLDDDGGLDVAMEGLKRAGEGFGEWDVPSGLENCVGDGRRGYVLGE